MKRTYRCAVNPRDTLIVECDGLAAPHVEFGVSVPSGYAGPNGGIEGWAFLDYEQVTNLINLLCDLRCNMGPGLKMEKWTSEP